MSGGKTISMSQTRIEALKLQSSAYGVTVQVVYGVNRIAGNLIWYGGFKAIAHTSTQGGGGKGGGVKVQSTDYTYTASVMMGLCHGKITGVPRVWKGKNQYSGGIAPGQLSTTTENTTVPAGGGFFNVSHASNYASSVSVTSTVTNDFGTYTTTLREGNDYTVAGGHYTFYNTDAFVSSANVSVTYQYTGNGVTQNALTQVGLGLTAGEIGQAPWSALATLAPTQNIGYSGLAYVAAQDYDLGSGAQVENHQFEVQGFMAYSVSANTPDVDPSDFVSDILTNTRYGASFDGNHIASVETWSNYCRASGLLMSPALTEQISGAELIGQAANLTNTGIVWSGDRIKFVPYGDANLSGNGRTYTPNVTPIYDLSDDNFLDAENPVQIDTNAQSDRYNHVRLEWTNRGSFNTSTQTFDGAYGYEIMEAKDQADIETNGLRSMDVIQAHWICDANVARTVSQLLLQRSINVVNTYTFRLPWSYALLEPMDLVTLTDTDQGLSKTAVRITSVTEDGEGTLTFTAEDFPFGVASATLYPNASGNGFQHNYNVAPGSIQTPVIFEAPAALAASGLEVWAAATGTGANWGGCDVWVSTDGSIYQNIARMYGGSRYGFLSAPISGDNLPVDVYGQLLNGTSADANALATLCFIGGNSPEYVAYTTATLTGNGAYTLTGLHRGAYGTAGGANHALNDPFVRCDSAIAKSGALDLSMIGKTLYFKFTSFNIYGGGEEEVSTVPAYTYNVTGAMYKVSTDGGQSFYQETDPSTQQAIGIGTIWVQPSTGVMKRWNGSSWDPYSALGTSDVTLINGANCSIASNVITKTGGTNGWGDGGAYSKEAYTGGAYAQALAPANGTDLTFGLNTDPTTDNSWTSIDYGIYFASVGNAIYAHESGVQSSQIGTWATGDVLTVAYDGSVVKYMQNGTVLRTVTPSSSSIKFYFDSAFWQVGAILKGVRFGPMSSNSWTSVGNRPKQFRVIAAGYSSTSTPSPGVGLYDGESGSALMGAARSYMLARIRRSDGVFTYSDSYDITASATSLGRTHGNTLAADLNATGSDSIAVVYTYDEPQSNRLDSTLLAAMKRCGASMGVYGSPQFKYRSAYVLVGIGGCGEGNGFEAYQGSIDSDPNAWCDASFILTAQGQLVVSGTSATPRTLADYSYTGDLNATYGATFGTNINGQASTNDILSGAVTQESEYDIASASVTKTQHSPNTPLGTYWDLIGTMSFTSSLAGNYAIEASCSVTYSGTGSISSKWIMGMLSLVIDLNNDGSIGSGEQVFSENRMIPWDGVTSITCSAQLANIVTANLAAATTYTWPIYAQREESTLATTINNLRIKVRKLKV